jgi:D-3-phosphoglycerate dehydrogenase / 2-oxoglutarate reductase
MPVAQVTTYPYGVSDPAPITALQAAGFTVRLSPHGRKHRSAETRALLGDVDVLIAGTETLDAETLTAGLPRLRHIAKVGVGLDGVAIDFCQRHGIAVTYTPEAPARSVVEQVFGLLFTVSRRFHEAHEGMRRGEWKRLTGPLWTGRTLGILGCGRIGRQVAEIARAFRMQVLAHDLIEDPTWAASHGVRYVGLEELLRASRLALLKPTAYLINTCRGPILDEAALLAALREERLAGAAIDVYQTEPYHGPLCQEPRALLTCHQGSCTFEGRLAMESGAAENAIAIAQGRRPPEARIVWLPGMAAPAVELD